MYVCTYVCMYMLTLFHLKSSVVIVVLEFKASAVHSPFGVTDVIVSKVQEREL